MRSGQGKDGKAVFETLKSNYPELALGATTYVSLYTSGAQSEMLDNMTGYVIVDTLLLRNGEKQTTMKQFKLLVDREEVDETPFRQ